MRILMTTDMAGGVWDYTVTLTHELVDRGHDVRVAVLGPAERARMAALPAGARASAADIRLEWSRGGLDDMAAAVTWLRELAREDRSEVAHLNQYSYAAHDLGAPTLVVAHSDVWSWWGAVYGEDAPAEWLAYRDAVRQGLAAADLVVSPTGYQSELLRSRYGRAADRIIRNGVRPRPQAAEPTREPPSLVWAGRAWDPAKDVATLDAALERLGPDAPVAHLVGPTRGPDGQRYVPRRFVSHGRQPRQVVDRLLARAGLYVAPSIYEPFGLAPLEAALHGCALVLSDIGSFRELWDGCALFFPAGDADLLACLLRSLLQDPARRLELARRAGQRAQESYSAARQGARYELAYQDLLFASARETACA